MASWWVTVALLAVAGTAVLADPQFIFPEDVDLSRSSRIVSGWEAEIGQFPYQLSLRMVSPAGAVTACGASIISAGWGITAAHCTAGRVTTVIRAGVVNLSRPELIFETTKYYNHPLYNEAQQQFVQPNDIGLLEFGINLVFSDNIQPIRLQSSADKDRNYAGVVLTASGWGRTWTNGQSPENMNWVFQIGVSNAECLNAYGGSTTIQDTTICSRYYNVTSQSTCQGDSGGPLTVVDDDGQTTLVGVTSFVSAWGCHIGMPAGFIRPGHYHDWFTEVTGENFDWVPAPTPESSESAESGPGSAESGPESSESRPESSESGSQSSESRPESSESGSGSSESRPESSESGSESSESRPESSESGSESSESRPESSESGPESSESRPESSESGPKSSESGPDSSESGPESSESRPVSSESAPESAESSPESSGSVPESV